MTFTDSELYFLFKLYCENKNINNHTIPKCFANTFISLKEDKAKKKFDKIKDSLQQKGYIRYSQLKECYNFNKDIKLIIENVLLKDSSVSLLGKFKNSAEFYYSEPLGYLAIVRCPNFILKKEFEILTFKTCDEFFGFILHFLLINKDDSEKTLSKVTNEQFKGYYYKQSKGKFKTLFSKKIKKIQSDVDLGIGARKDGKIVLSCYGQNGKRLLIIKVLPCNNTNYIYAEELLNGDKNVIVGKLSGVELINTIFLKGGEFND